MSDDFLYRNVTAFGRQVFRLGLATNYGINGEDLEWALEQGVNYVFWTPNARRVTKSLKAAIKRDRESIVLACGPTTGYFGGSIKRACDRLLKTLGTEYLDVFQPGCTGYRMIRIGMDVFELIDGIDDLVKACDRAQGDIAA